MRARTLLNRCLRVCITAKFWVRVANRLFPKPSLKFAVEPSGGAAWFHCLSLNRSQTFGAAVAGLRFLDRFRLAPYRLTLRGNSNTRSLTRLYRVTPKRVRGVPAS